MFVERISDFGSLQEIQADWNALSHEIPFRQWEWMSNWWQAYSAGRDLYVLVARDKDARVVGIAPFYRECTLAGGRVVQLMGNGKTCSDYQSLLVRPQDIEDVGLAFARFLAAGSGMRDHGWDQCELEAIPENDAAIIQLSRRLQQFDVMTSIVPGEQCWCIDLPDSWDQFLRGLRSNLRRKLKSLDRRYIGNDRATFRIAESEQDVEYFFDYLVDLHQRRWHDAGKAGCFDHFGFERFMLHAVRDFDRSERLFFAQLEIDGEVTATSCLLKSPNRYFVYQCGIDPKGWEHQPGWLMNMMILRKLIDEGVRHCDYLRGEERYKKELGARPVPQMNIRFAAPHTKGRIHHQLWNTQVTLKAWGQQVASAMRG